MTYLEQIEPHIVDESVIYECDCGLYYGVFMTPDVCAHKTIEDQCKGALACLALWGVENYIIAFHNTPTMIGFTALVEH